MGAIWGINFLLRTLHVDGLHTSLPGWGNGRRLYPNARGLAVVLPQICAEVVAIAPIMTNPVKHSSLQGFVLMVVMGEAR
ncbi:hypothetical protein D3C80_2069150 [compost metagenome]